MSLFTLLRNTSASRKWILEGTIGKLMQWLEINHPLYVGCIQHFFCGRKWQDGFSFQICPCHQSPFCQLTSLGTGQNAGPFLRRECSAYVSPDRYILYLHKKLYVCSNSVKYYDNMLLINYKNLSLFTLNLLR